MVGWCSTIQALVAAAAVKALAPALPLPAGTVANRRLSTTAACRTAANGASPGCRVLLTGPARIHRLHSACLSE